MKNQNLLNIFIVFFLAVIIIYLVIISIIILLKIEKIDDEIRSLRGADPNNLESETYKRIEKLFSLVNLILFRQNETVSVFNDKFDDTLQKLQSNSELLSDNIDELRSSQVNKDTFSIFMDQNSLKINNILNDNEKITKTLSIFQQNVYNLTREFREHLGYTNPFLNPEVPLFPEQNSSCGQCTFVLDLDTHLLENTYIIKPFLYITNSTKPTPLLDLNNADILLNGNNTLRDNLDVINSNQIIYSESLEQFLSNITTINETINNNAKLISQVINSVGSLTDSIQMNIPPTMISYSLSLHITDLIQTSEQAFFLSSNTIPSLSVLATFSVFILQPNINSYSYSTTVTGSLIFTINNLPAEDSIIIKTLKNPMIFNLFPDTFIPKNYFYYMNLTSNNYNYFDCFLYDYPYSNLNGAFIYNSTEIRYKNSPISSSFRIKSDQNVANPNVLQIFFPLLDEQSAIFVNNTNRISYNLAFSFLS